MGRAALVVDDSMLIRHTVCRFLEERGMEVQAASNGAEALSVLQGFQPDVIVTDLSMPKMDGKELIETVKATKALQQTPIVILSARRGAADMLASEKLADFVIYKDIDIADQLESALEALFAASR